ncbi:MAG: permease prefix domain 1-containing protein [Pirellulaceae bacterium]|jgi:hypothetical protein|nr:permease prefix domain 1-containing protein [Pirellulaceae bacterium]MDP6556421.1 permease prefix domain 1-containing protein [Pirellulaceae bacterium]
MSQHEFDQFLSLLSRLLRLSSSQREAIASELRDHLEERLTELLSQGVPRHKAVETALGEFGDTAGLAGEFVQIFRKQRRRWMMRMTLGTAAGLAVLVMLTTAFWPHGRSSVSLDHIVAQDDVAPADEDTLLAPAPDATNRFAESELQKRLDIDFIDLPIVEALDALCSQVGLQFYLKVKYLEDLGIAADTPVNLSLNQVSAEMALELILEQLELTYIVHDGIILVTTEEDLDNVAEVRVYNCRDLLAINVSDGAGEGGAGGDDGSEGGFGPIGETPPIGEKSGDKRKRRSTPTPGATTPRPGQSNTAAVPRNVLSQFGGGGKGRGGGGGLGGFGGGEGGLGGFGGGGMGGQAPPLNSRGEQLMDIIKTAVVPDSWDEVGGPGTIAEFDGLIVIRHNPRVHRQVERVLEMLREAAKKQAWIGQPGFGARNGGQAGGGGFF